MKMNVCLFFHFFIALDRIASKIYSICVLF